MHPLYQRVCNAFLRTTNWFWSGHKKTYATSLPQIMNTVCFSIGPGATAQPLHRDDWCYHVVARKVEVYPEDLQRDVGVGFFVAGKKATRENGCTRFIPGSHLWEHEREPEDELCAFAELEKGWYFFYLSFFFFFFLLCQRGQKGGRQDRRPRCDQCFIEKEKRKRNEMKRLTPLPPILQATASSCSHPATTEAEPTRPRTKNVSYIRAS